VKLVLGEYLMMMDPILHSLCPSKYLRGLSKPSHPRTGLGLHANHQNDNMLTAQLTTQMTNAAISAKSDKWVHPQLLNVNKEQAIITG
jgi:hypothetical protein